MKRKVSVAIATHKKYEFLEDDGFFPLFLGGALNAGKEKALRDDVGESIANKNPFYCELTGIYWLWKNCDSEFYGLVHYRRYFNSLGVGYNFRGFNIASSNELVSILDAADIILPKRRNYFVESIRSHYAHAHHEKDFDTVREIIQERHPEYLKCFDEFSEGTKLSLYNMFVMRRSLFLDYCEWLFGILFAAEARIDFSIYGPYQRRVFGFLAERLLNVWVSNNIEKSKVRYLDVVNLEGESLLEKAVDLLARRFFSRRKD